MVSGQTARHGRRYDTYATAAGGQGLQALSPRRWPPLGAFIKLPALRVVHDCDSTCIATSAAFEQGTSVTLTASAANDSSFTGWSLEGCSGTSTCTVSMIQARTVRATFTLQQFPL